MTEREEREEAAGIVERMDELRLDFERTWTRLRGQKRLVKRRLLESRLRVAVRNPDPARDEALLSAALEFKARAHFARESMNKCVVETLELLEQAGKGDSGEG